MKLARTPTAKEQSSNECNILPLYQTVAVPDSVGCVKELATTQAGTHDLFIPHVPGRCDARSREGMTPKAELHGTLLGPNPSFQIRFGNGPIVTMPDEAIHQIASAGGAGKGRWTHRAFRSGLAPLAGEVACSTLTVQKSRR